MILVKVAEVDSTYLRKWGLRVGELISPTPSYASCTLTTPASHASWL